MKGVPTTKADAEARNARVKAEEALFAKLTPEERRRHMQAKALGKKSPIIMDAFKALGLITDQTNDNPTHNLPPCPEPQQIIRHEPLATGEGKEAHAGQVHVRVVSYRTRLIDPDNLCPKYFVDCCRYGGFIKNDTAKEIEFSVSQTKVKTKAEECTEITITTP